MDSNRNLYLPSFGISTIRSSSGRTRYQNDSRDSNKCKNDDKSHRILTSTYSLF